MRRSHLCCWAIAALTTAAADTGTSSSDPCFAVNGVFTVSVDIYASETGEFKIIECGNTVAPVIAVVRGTTYTFRQDNETNWYHPLGFRYAPFSLATYLPNSAPTQLAPTTPAPGGDAACAASGTCQAPEYFEGSSAVTPDEYAKAMTFPRDHWLAGGGYEVQLTITDATATRDLFYECGIHEVMEGRIKILDGAGTAVSSADVPASARRYRAPSEFDAKCGTYNLDAYREGNGRCGDKVFFCADGFESAAARAFGECLYAMDCAMDQNMVIDVHASSLAATFVYQMIPHHQNAVNMAKALLKTETLGDGPLDDDMIGMMWEIVNGQNAQINTMYAYLAANAYPLADKCTVEPVEPVEPGPTDADGEGRCCFWGPGDDWCAPGGCTEMGDSWCSLSQARCEGSCSNNPDSAPPRWCGD